MTGEDRVVGAYLAVSSSLSLGCSRAAKNGKQYLLETDDFEQGTPGSVLGLHRRPSTQSQPASGFIPSLGTKGRCDPCNGRLGRLEPSVSFSFPSCGLIPTGPGLRMEL